MVYQQCGPLCPQTCDNIGTSNCIGGCAEGCFCPDGQVFLNGQCVNPIACPGEFYVYLQLHTHHIIAQHPLLCILLQCAVSVWPLFVINT